jgi:hypothetical protein
MQYMLGLKEFSDKPARMIIGAVLIKHKMNLSDEETIQAIRENPYMQYMLGLKEFSDKPVFDSSLFVTIRKRIGKDDFNDMSESLLKLQIKMAEEEKEKSDKEDDENRSSSSCDASTNETSSSIRLEPEVDSSHKGILKVDATCSDAEMRYPTDIDLLNDGVEVIDRIIDHICAKNDFSRPNTHLKEIHSKYLNVIKQHSRPVGARPAEGIQPAAQAKADARIGEMTIAKAVLNIGGMYPAAMIAIALEAVGVWNRQLSAKHLQDFHRHGGGLVRQNANEADGGQQNGITQTVMVTPQHLDGFTVFIAQVEVTFQLFTAGRINIAAKTVALLLSQKTDRH